MRASLLSAAIGSKLRINASAVSATLIRAP
jgi:hypothetical protein